MFRCVLVFTVNQVDSETIPKQILNQSVSLVFFCFPSNSLCFVSVSLLFPYSTSLKKLLGPKFFLYKTIFTSVLLLLHSFQFINTWPFWQHTYFTYKQFFFHGSTTSISNCFLQANNMNIP